MRPRILGTLAGVATLALVASGCGFDDKLTPRGFIKEGDVICAEALIKARVDAQRAASSGDEQASIAALATGYSTVAEGIRGLDVADEDLEMRDAIVKNYSEAAGKIESAANAGEALGVVAELQPHLVTVRNYGFRACGQRQAAA